MRYARTLIARTMFLLFAAACWLAPVAEAWAQQGGISERKASPWVMPYALVLLGIGLGLLILCKPSRRREKAKVEQ